MSISDAIVDPGSFRDPAGVVFQHDGRILRALSLRGASAFEPVLESELFASWQQRGVAVHTSVATHDQLPLEGLPFLPELVLEHERVKFISYPYEWPFDLLKSAALHHLDLQIEALDAGFTFSDSSAYNIQFEGSKPVLMDVLSLRPYTEGEYWVGYRQFCEQFLNPLLLTAKSGLPFGPWYRGALHGIPVEHTAAILPLRKKLSLNMLMHVVLHARLSRSSHRLSAASSNRRKLTKSALRAMLAGMRSWVSSLKSHGQSDTFWADYDKHNSYASDEAQRKRAFVAAYVSEVVPDMLFDIGCNSGDYSELALKAGAKAVVGFDFDHGALNAAVARARSRSLNLLPLFLDVSNPSPDQGWRQLERKGMSERARADGMIALALIHHLAIGANIPLLGAVEWLVQRAATGVIEFVPKSDPMVQGMLAHREDVFDDYEIAVFRRALENVAKIVDELEISEGGRTLFRYEAKS